MKYLLMLIMIFFIGCSTNNIHSLYVSSFLQDKTFVKDYNENDTMYNKMNEIDNSFFKTNNTKIIDVNLNQDTLNQFKKKNIILNNIKEVYKGLVEGQSISNFNLTGSDYLTLYKMLFINQKEIFKREKQDLINDFLFSIEDYYYLDFKYIKNVMEKENFKKLNKLKKQIIKLEKENNE